MRPEDKRSDFDVLVRGKYAKRSAGATIEIVRDPEPKARVRRARKRRQLKRR